MSIKHFKITWTSIISSSDGGGGGSGTQAGLRLWATSDMIELITDV